MEAKNKLKGKALDVMRVFWSTDKPLVASEISKINPTLSINTVQAVLKVLLKNGHVEVADIVYSGTVLTRRYSPVLTANDYMVGHFKEIITESSDKCSTSSFVMELLEKDEKESEAIDELELMLKKRKKQLKESG